MALGEVPFLGLSFSTCKDETVVLLALDSLACGFFCPITDGNMTESYFERLLTSLYKKGKLISSLWRSGSQPVHPSLLLHIAPSKIKLLRQPLESQALDVGTDRCLGDYRLILLCRFFS